MKPQPGEYAPFYQKYIDKVGSVNPIELLEDQLKTLQLLFEKIEEEKSKYRYATGKWSIKEVIGHIIDSERVFSYRILRFSRKDINAIPGFDENAYIHNSCYDDIPFKDLVEELILLRKANILMFKLLKEEMLSLIGNANGNNVSVRALLYIIAGHTQHHLDIINERYLDYRK